MPPDGVLNVQLKASRRLAALLGLAHVGAAVVLLIVPLAIALQVALGVALAASLWHAVRLHAWRIAPGACRRLSVQRGGSARLELYSGAVWTGRVLASSRVGPLLTVIHVRRDDNGRRASVVLLPDSASAEQLRALRVWLRFNIDRA